MNNKEQVSYLLTFLETSGIYTKSTNEAIALLVDLTKTEGSVAREIHKELVERVSSDGSPTFKRNALMALVALCEAHPEITDFRKIVPQKINYELILERARLLE